MAEPFQPTYTCLLDVWCREGSTYPDDDPDYLEVPAHQLKPFVRSPFTEALAINEQMLYRFFLDGSAFEAGYANQPGPGSLLRVFREGDPYNLAIVTYAHGVTGSDGRIRYFYCLCYPGLWRPEDFPPPFVVNRAVSGLDRGMG